MVIQIMVCLFMGFLNSFKKSIKTHSIFVKRVRFEQIIEIKGIIK